MSFSKLKLLPLLFLGSSLAQAYDFSPIYTCAGPYACVISSYLGIQFPDGTRQTTAALPSSFYTFSLPLVNTAGTISIPAATGSVNGYLTSANWTTFNNKQSALTIGNLTDAGTDGIIVTSGTGAVIGSGTSFAQHVADSTHNGYLNSTDWTSFNNKQAAGSYVTTARTISTTAPLAGGGALSSDLTLSIPASTASQNGYLASTDFGRFATDQISGEYEIAYNRTYTLSLAIPYSGAINTLKIQTASGTATVAININGTPVTSMSAVSVSSVLATATASGANTFSANDTITLVVSSAALANDMVFTLKVTKQ